MKASNKNNPVAVGMHLWIFVFSGTFDLQLDLTGKQIKDLEWITENILARNNFVKFKKLSKLLTPEMGFPFLKLPCFINQHKWRISEE